MGRRLALALLALVALAVVLPAGAQGRAHTLRAQQGDVRALVTYRDRTATLAHRQRIRIYRVGQRLESARLVRNSDRPTDVTVRDLDGDSEPEVIADLFSGGAHCCTYSYIYRYDPEKPGYVRLRWFWGEAGYRLRDLDQDGVPEVSSLDNRFLELFTARAFSALPIQIWRYDRGTMTDVTREFPPSIESDLRAQLRRYRLIRRQRERESRDVRGALAAYLADSFLLGRGPEGWRYVCSKQRRGELRAWSGGPGGRRYIRALARVLRRYGYDQANTPVPCD